MAEIMQLRKRSGLGARPYSPSVRANSIVSSIIRPAIANHAMQHILNSKLVQPKLAVSQSPDSFEREADRIAESVLRMPGDTAEDGQEGKGAPVFRAAGATESPVDPHSLFENKIARQEEAPQQEPAQLQQTDECPCDPPPPFPCANVRVESDRTRADVVVEAFQAAATWLPDAQSAVQELVDAPEANRSRLRAAGPFRNHFSWPPASGEARPLRDTPEVVLGVINRLFDNISSTICAGCPSECPCEGEEGSIVHACTRAAWHGTNCYTFCDPFFTEAGGTLRAKIAVHEMMHNWEDKSDRAYESDSDYPPDAILAQQNADSYAALIRDLGEAARRERRRRR